MLINIHVNKYDDNTAAAKGTLQLSSTAGINSTAAHRTDMSNSLPIKSNALNFNGSITPQPISHDNKANEPRSAPKINAVLPATDLSLLNIHLLVLPYLRPIKSASPSPTAIAAIEMIPTGESVKQKSVTKSSTNTYTKGPPNASSALPDREMACANSFSDPSAVFLPSLSAAKNNLIAFINGTMLANTLAPNAFENKGQTNTNNGAENVCIIFLESRGCSFPTVTG